jgi:hypothetical protein
MYTEILEYILIAIGAVVVLMVAIVIAVTIYDYIKGRIRYRQLQKERKISHMVERYIEIILDQPKRLQSSLLRQVINEKEIIRDIEVLQGTDDYHGIFKELLEEIK